MEKKFIPVCEPFLDGNEKKYVNEALDTGWISSSGKYIPAFEQAFASYIGAGHGIAVTNGTVAIHLALAALGVKEGDEVIIPDFTMIATAFAVCYTGAIPVFVDAERQTWNMDPAQIEAKITKKTKAIIVVHIYGHPCDMNAIMALAKKYDLKVIEDAAEVHGAEYFGKKCGAIGHISTFSFFANKIATTGEGGMVLTSDDELADRCRYYKNLCFPTKGERVYLHNDIGFNYRMSNLHAAIGLAQVEKLDLYVERRRENNRLYREYMSSIPGIVFQEESPNNKNVYWMNGVVIDERAYGITRNDLMRKLKDDGIDTRYFFRGMHEQESLRKFGSDCTGTYPVTNWLAVNGFYLPSGSNLTQEEIRYIADRIIFHSSSGK